MTLRLSAAARNASLDAAFDRVNAGAAAGTIEYRTGAQPASVATAASGTVLVTFTLANPAFAAATGDGVKDLDADPDLTATAVATGAAGWARAYDSDGVAVFDMSIGTSSADIIINSTSITTGQEVKLTLGSISDPA